MEIKIINNLRKNIKKLSEKKVIMGWKDPDIINLVFLLFFGGEMHPGLAKKFNIKGYLPPRNLKEIFTTNKFYIKYHREEGVKIVHKKIEELISNSKDGNFDIKFILKELGDFYIEKYRELLNNKGMKLYFGIKSNAPSTIKDKGFDNPLYKTGELAQSLRYDIK